jgi:hypothetical protein
MQAPVLVMSTSNLLLPRSCSLLFEHRLADTSSFADTQSGERQTGRKAQLSNIAAAKTYARFPASCRYAVWAPPLIAHTITTVSQTSSGHASAPRPC